MRKTRIFLPLLAALLLASCGDDTESSISRLTAEMCDMHSASRGVADYAVTDAGLRLAFDRPLKVAWAETPDSTYRTMLYYNKADDGKAVTPLRAESVLTFMPKTKAEAEKWLGRNDALEVATAWLAPNRRYLNMELAVKTGTAESDAQKHFLGVVCDTVMTSAKGRRFCYRICHSRNGLPEYYTVTAYASIPLSGVAGGDTVTVVYTSRKGVVYRDFPF